MQNLLENKLSWDNNVGKFHTFTGVELQVLRLDLDVGNHEDNWKQCS